MYKNDIYVMFMYIVEGKKPTNKTTTNSHCHVFRQTERNTSMAKSVNFRPARQGHILKVFLRLIFTSILGDVDKY